MSVPKETWRRSIFITALSFGLLEGAVCVIGWWCVGLSDPLDRDLVIHTSVAISLLAVAYIAHLTGDTS
jgi:hypothetical protein